MLQQALQAQDDYAHANFYSSNQQPLPHLAAFTNSVSLATTSPLPLIRYLHHCNLFLAFNLCDSGNTQQWTLGIVVRLQLP